MDLKETVILSVVLWISDPACYTEPYLWCGHDTHLSESIGTNVQMATLRLREACMSGQGNTVFGPESELEPGSLMTQSSVGFPGSGELSLVLTPNPHSLTWLGHLSGLDSCTIGPFKSFFWYRKTKPWEDKWLVQCHIAGPCATWVTLSLTRLLEDFAFLNWHLNFSCLLGSPKMLFETRFEACTVH